MVGRCVTEEKALVTAMSTVAIVHITSYTNRIMTGYVYNAYLDQTCPFSDSLTLLRRLENLFDRLSFPARFEDYRHFSAQKTSPPKSRKERVPPTMNEKPKDDKATFVIHVQFRRNATWQGTIQWVDQNKRQSFRSTLEMIRLIDEALETSCEEPKIQWD